MSAKDALGEFDLGELLDRMGELPELKEGYWTRRVAAAAALDELAGLEARPGVIPEPRDQQFLRFAEAVDAAYAGLNDQEIAGANETPEIVRYLARALGEYAKKVTEHLKEHGGIKTPDRYGLLANALLASGERGGSHGLTRNSIEDAINAFLEFHYDHPGEDRDEPEFRIRAFKAACQKVFGDKVTDRDKKKREALRSELEKHVGPIPLAPKKARRIKLT